MQKSTPDAIVLLIVRVDYFKQNSPFASKCIPPTDNRPTPSPNYVYSAMTHKNVEIRLDSDVF